MPDQQSANVNPMSGPGDSRPVPDPTLLTSQLISREVQMLRDLIETRLDGMDKAMVVFHDNIVRVPTDVDKQVDHLKELHDEKFHSIQTQFSERDTRVEQTAKDTKVAVDAALQAAEKAVEKQNEAFSLSINKSEAATLKQIDGQAVLLQSATEALNGKIDDIKERLTRIEGRDIGTTAARVDAGAAHTSNRGDNAFVLSVVMAGVGVISLIVTLFVVFNNR